MEYFYQSSHEHENRTLAKGGFFTCLIVK